jgi:hypothetical protein
MASEEETAELLGIFAGDGCLQPPYACIWGNLREERPYYDSVVRPLFERVVGRTVRPHAKESNGVYGFYACGRETVRFFQRHGFETGRKVYSVRVPGWILDTEDREVQAAFLRGFADADGTLNFALRSDYLPPKSSTHYYPRIFLYTASAPLAEGLARLLDEVRLAHTRYVKIQKKPAGSIAHVLALRGPQKLEKWMQAVGFHNAVQRSKYLLWKKFGAVPPNTTLEERERLLKGLVDIRDYYPKMGP